MLNPYHSSETVLVGKQHCKEKEGKIATIRISFEEGDGKLSSSKAKSKKTLNFFRHSIDHFTVVSLVTWPWIVSEAGVDLVLIETSLLFHM